MSSRSELAILDQASELLARASSFEEVKTIRDKAEAARTFAKAARLGLDLQNRAAEVKLRAERRAGQFLSGLKLRGGDGTSKGRRAPLKLEDLGITRDQSKQWRCVSAVPEEAFWGYLRTMGEQGREVTSAGLMRLARASCGAQPNESRDGVSHPAIKSKARRVLNAPAAADLITELRYHCQLLLDLLRPVYDQGLLELKQSECRVIGSLLQEMDALLAELSVEWQSHRLEIVG